MQLLIVTLKLKQFLKTMFCQVYLLSCFTFSVLFEKKKKVTVYIQVLFYVAYVIATKYAYCETGY